MATSEIKIKVSDATLALMQKQLDGVVREMRDIEQIAGKVLGYPFLCDDPENFPGATPEDGVVIAPHSAATIVAELAGHYDRARELLDLIARILMADIQGSEVLSRSNKGLILHNIELLRPGLLGPMVVDKLEADG